MTKKLKKKLKKRKGFTLIELLAVIVVLAIIALITIPPVMGLTSTTRNKANQRSLEGHIRNMNSQLAAENFKAREIADGTYSFTELELSRFPEKDEVRCEEYDIVDNYVEEARNCKIDDKDYFYIGEKSIESEEYTEILSKRLGNVILADNPTIYSNPTITTNISATEDPHGLYVSTDTNSGKPTYYYRGNVNNNYVKFAGTTWRIIRINEDGTIRIMKNSGLNGNGYFNESSEGWTYMYYSKGIDIGNPSHTNARYTVEKWYNENVGNNSKYSSKIANKNGNYFCEELRVVWGAINRSEPETNFAKTYGSYKATFKCNADGNGHQYVKSDVGLITYDEVVYAGGHVGSGHTEQNYWLYTGGGIWTMSPAGVDSRSNICTEWYIYPNGQLLHKEPKISGRAVKPVVNLKKTVTVTKEYDSSLGVDVYVVE